MASIGFDVKAQSNASPDNINAFQNAIVLVVNDIPVTKYDIEMRMRLTAFMSGETLSKNILQEIYNKSIEDLIADILREQKLKEESLSLPQTFVDQETERLARINNITVEQLRQLVEENGITFEQFQHAISINLSWRTYISDMYVDQITIPEKELDRRIENISQRENAGNLQVAEIFIPFGASSQKAKEQIQTLKSEISKGASFGVLAEIFSKRPSSKSQGVIGWFTRATIPEPIKPYLQDTAVTQISEIHELADGYAIYSILTTRDKKEKIDAAAKDRYKNRIETERLFQFSEERYQLLLSEAFIDYLS